MGKLGGEMKVLAKHCGGSHKTVNDRIHIVQRFDQHLRALNVQIQRVAQIKVRHIESYIHSRLAQGIGKRTLQNEMASLRTVLQQAGRKQVTEHERLTNKSLGLSGASRNGTRQAITPDHYRHVLEMARAKDPGLAAALELARLMGLRSQEAVRSTQSLKTWKQAVERGDTRLTVVFGTKGGRPRETVILDTGAVRKALDNALAVAENRNNRLIDKPDLKKRDVLLAQPGGAYWADWCIFSAFAALCVGAGCHSPLSGTGVQQERVAGNGGDGFGAW